MQGNTKRDATTQFASTQADPTHGFTKQRTTT
jgi:hypothetical protein